MDNALITVCGTFAVYIYIYINIQAKIRLVYGFCGNIIGKYIIARHVNTHAFEKYLIPCLQFCRQNVVPFCALLAGKCNNFTCSLIQRIKHTCLECS